MASPRFHKRIMLLSLPFVRLFLRLKTGFRKTPAPELPDHFLLICNHVTNFDPFLLAAILRHHTYFVATEHILGQGWLSKILVFLVDPIGLPKGGAAAGAVMETLRRLKDGHSVAIFAEGNCSWDGLTGSFSESTGKMVQVSGAPLVTCRIRGGYFTHPRWAYSTRRGPFTAEVVAVYQPEELKAMKPAEINRRIAEDIFEDAYAAQKKDPHPYKGKDLAKGIGHALVICPKCHRIDSVRGRGNTFSCECGLKGSYDEYGYLCINDCDFTTVTEWDAWQHAYLQSLPDPKEGDPETVLAEDECLRLVIHSENHERTEVTRGRAAMSAQSFRVGEKVFPLSQIADMAVRLKGTVSFSLKDGQFFELMPLQKGSFYSGRKYKLLFDRFHPV